MSVRHWSLRLQAIVGLAVFSGGVSACVSMPKGFDLPEDAGLRAAKAEEEHAALPEWSRSWGEPAPESKRSWSLLGGKRETAPAPTWQSVSPDSGSHKRGQFYEDNLIVRAAGGFRWGDYSDSGVIGLDVLAERLWGRVGGRLTFNTDGGGAWPILSTLAAVYEFPFSVGRFSSLGKRVDFGIIPRVAIGMTGRVYDEEIYETYNGAYYEYGYSDYIGGLGFGMTLGVGSEWTFARRLVLGGAVAGIFDTNGIGGEFDMSLGWKF